MAVTRIEVRNRTVIADGAEWGGAGPYERLDGVSYHEVDPRDPLNAIIVNLDKAARNVRDLVAFSTPFRILKPVDMRKGNRKIWYGVNNRGLSVELSFRSFPWASPSCNPATLEEIGANNVLLREGYAVVDAGWHADCPDSADLLVPTFPLPQEADGAPITGRMRVEFSSALGEPIPAGLSLPLSYSGLGQWRPYEAADTNTENASLTVRVRARGARRTIAPSEWAFGRCSGGRETFTPTTTDITLFEGFEADKIYELIYHAKNPLLMGLGYAVTRDLAAFLRRRTHDSEGNRNPLALSESETGITRVYASGTSSTGMYMREFLYLGFNEDEQHRQVFDAVTIYSAGTHRLFANVQFSHPTFFSGQDWHHDYTANSMAPFSFAIVTDPVSGAHDGILKRPQTDPLVLQVDEELLFWQWKASLNVVDGRGAPIPTPDNVRLYYQDGFGHIGAAGLLAEAAPRGPMKHDVAGNQPVAICVAPRALAKVMDDWADRGIAPPPSNYPRLEKGELVSLAEYRSLFPRIPGVTPPQVMNELNVLDFGPGFSAVGGVQTRLPPEAGDAYQLLVPRPGADGSGVAGIRGVWTRAPLGSNLGWNLRTGDRAPDLAGLLGSFAPFALTKAERIDSGDERLSLEERYHDHDGFVRAVRAVVTDLVSERFLLPEDADAFVKAAEESDILI